MPATPTSADELAAARPARGAIDLRSDAVTLPTPDGLSVGVKPLGAG